MYWLNNENISKERMEELLDDLAAFPFDVKDFQLGIDDRKKKYLKILDTEKALQISETLTIYKK